MVTLGVGVISGDPAIADSNDFQLLYRLGAQGVNIKEGFFGEALPVWQPLSCCFILAEPFSEERGSNETRVFRLRDADDGIHVRKLSLSLSRPLSPSLSRSLSSSLLSLSLSLSEGVACLGVQ